MSQPVSPRFNSATSSQRDSQGRDPLSSAGANRLGASLRQLDAKRPDYAVQFVQKLLEAAIANQASDIHLQPTQTGIQLRWRMDGVLQMLGEFSRGSSADVVSRLKVLAQLLTYRTDSPQEGRIRNDALVSGPGSDANSNPNVDMRVSTFPTLHGERVVVRLFASGDQFLSLDQLGLPDELTLGIRRVLAESSGAFVITGPAGSGKTTTAYACLREIVGQSEGGRSVVTLEDPIEVPLQDVSQSQVNPQADFSLVTGLKSLLRQDPEVILIGEIRDKETADLAMQASLTGQLVLTTFHAGSAAGAVARLSEMGIEPYRLRSGLLSVLSQRLVRKLCHCAKPVESTELLLGLDVVSANMPVGCSECGQTGYRGRLLLAELLEMESKTIGDAVLARCERQSLQISAIESGMVTLGHRALEAIESGKTSPAEIRRVFGFVDLSAKSSNSL